MNQVSLGISSSSTETKLDSLAPRFCKVIHYNKSSLLKLAKVGPAVQFRTGILLLGSHLKTDQKSFKSQEGKGIFASKGVSGRVEGPGSQS